MSSRNQEHSLKSFKGSGSGQEERRLKTNTATLNLSDIHSWARPSLQSKACSGGSSYGHTAYRNSTIFTWGERNQENIAINWWVQFSLSSTQAHAPAKCEGREVIPVWNLTVWSFMDRCFSYIMAPNHKPTSSVGS